jgi:hypothetical protein
MEYEGLALPIRTIIIEAILVIVIGVVSNKIEKTFNYQIARTQLESLKYASGGVGRHLVTYASSFKYQKASE